MSDRQETDWKARSRNPGVSTGLINVTNPAQNCQNHTHEQHGYIRGPGGMLITNMFGILQQLSIAMWMNLLPEIT